MDLHKLKDRINEYQRESYFHPLTCRVDECRTNLEAEIINKAVILVCPACGSKQDWIPDFFYNAEYEKNLVGPIKRMREALDAAMLGDMSKLQAMEDEQ